MLPLSKVADAGDFLAPELAPYLEEIGALRPPRGAHGSAAADATLWQEAMVLRTLDGAGRAKPGCSVACIGAGAGAVAFALARRGAQVFAVDRYLESTEASAHVAPAGMLDRPEQYAAAAVPLGHVLALHSPSTRVNLPSGSVDAVFSAGLERLGSAENVAAAAREIGRILRVGGVAAIATMFRLGGPDDRRSFDDRYMLFNALLLTELVAKPAGLTLRAPITTEPSDATFEARHMFADFDRGDGVYAILEHKRAATSDLVVYHEGFLFCPVVVTLHKDSPPAAALDAESHDSGRKSGKARSVRSGLPPATRR